MLQVHLWQRVLVALILIGGILIALPNVLPDNVRSRLPGGWGNQTVSLGLDLQGGSDLLLEVQLDEVQKDKVETLLLAARHALRKAHIAFDKTGVTGDAISLHIVGHENVDQAKSLIDALNPTAGGGVLAGSTRQYEVTVSGDDRITMQMTDAYKKQALNEI